MSAREIREIIERLGCLNEDARTDLHDFALKLMEQLYRLVGAATPDYQEISKAVNHLAEVLMQLKSRDEDQEMIKSTAAMLHSLARQMADSRAIRTDSDPRSRLKGVLSGLYRNLITKDTSSFSELAKNNNEARDKIKRLAAFVYGQTSDEKVRDKMTLIAKQASVIQ